MSDIKKQTEQMAKECPAQTRDVEFGQVSFKIACYPDNNPTAAAIQCTDLLDKTIPTTADCKYISQWDNQKPLAKRDYTVSCFTICNEIRKDAKPAASLAASNVASISSLPPANTAATTGITANVGNAGVNVYPNFTLTFAAVLFFMFMLLNRKH